MNQIDSGFVGSYLPKIPSEDICSSTTTTSQRKSKMTTVHSETSFQASTMESRRPVSEQRSRPFRQQSSTSSSENSTNRSKSRGHSKPSSRRTSCTMMDPNRPARHYRMKSFQTPPTAPSQDIDDVLALHFRSCSIFTNPSYQSNPNSGLPSPTLSQNDAIGFPGAATRFSTDSLRVVDEIVSSRQSEDTIADPEKLNTTMHWTSPCTRRREYERIDKANSGVRGFFRRVTPRCVSGPQEKFFEKDDAESDAGSVRRYRLDDPDDHLMDEKNTARPRISPAPKPHCRPGIKKRWTCF
jgi:hypothetical protein